MESATTSTVESTTAAVKATAATMEASSRTVRKAPSAEAAVKTTPAEPAVKASSTEPAATVPIVSKAATPTAAPTPTPTVPGAGANEYASRKPVRPVVTVRRTSVGIIIVVPVIAYRWAVSITRPESDTHADLRL